MYLVVKKGNIARELCQKSDFSLKKRMKGFHERIFVYVLEFMLTFDKMQNASPLMCTKFGI